MEDQICPKCKKRFLRVHSILKHDDCGQLTGVNYEWECYWCDFREGDYLTIADAKKEYKEIYGGDFYEDR